MGVRESLKLHMKEGILVSSAAARKARVCILLGTLAACAYFLARGTGWMLAAEALSPGLATARDCRAGERPVGPGEQSRVFGSVAPDPDQILERNIFDSLTGPLWPPPAVTDKTLELPDPEQVDSKPPDADNPPPACEQDLALVASVYSNRRPEKSFAAIDAPGTDSSLFYRQGMQVADNEVVSVYPWAVYLKRSSGEYCSLRMFTEENRQKSGKQRKASRPAPRRSKKPPAVSKVAGEKSGLSAREMQAGIHKLGDDRYRIDRSLVDRVLKERASLGRIARFVPHRRGGEVAGIKVYSIRRNSLLDRLGLKNGDLVRTVNGFDVTNVDAALQAYTKLRDAGRITVSLERKRSNRNLNYVIQ